MVFDLYVNIYTFFFKYSKDKFLKLRKILIDFSINVSISL